MESRDNGDIKRMLVHITERLDYVETFWRRILIARSTLEGDGLLDDKELRAIPKVTLRTIARYRKKIS